MKAFITDMGATTKVRNEETGVEWDLERYGVWVVSARGRREVAEVGNDLQTLMDKYGVTQDRVFKITSNGQGPKV